ncbi:MAG: alanine dehydrogenase [Gammaproteobacteria bacterium]|nr:alanine dehydrogenase [Gammaproteobacteria bacterium]MCY4198833.1 alanine dehydrogenase [Gammaproteobacteria bacterium]MCY4277150.1 alanine dehydrogenase [Gammaproteobacteria bacterium]MCY4323352.1 alanine dehydrogenase [Gammaproteobacteria bacterium]
MRIGVPKEIKNHERRVGLTPDAVCVLFGDGHEVMVQRGAGAGIGLIDEAFVAAGAVIVEDAEALYGRCDLIVKVKEPQAGEFKYLRPGLTVFGYLHLAAEPRLAEALKSSNCTAVAYETVADFEGRLPLLAPMSAIAGRLSIQMGAWALQSTNGGKGQLMSPVPGAPAARVTILGAGNAGQHAMESAIGLLADVCIVDLDTARLAYLSETHGSLLRTATPESVHELVAQADLVIGAVLLPGAAAPKLVSRQMVNDMSPGSVLVDISIDQGGCFETSKGTTHDDPTFIEDDVVHYCVTNMPAAVSRSATFALVSATLPYVRELASCGADALQHAAHGLGSGLNVRCGEIMHPAVRASLAPHSH